MDIENIGSKRTFLKDSVYDFIKEKILTGEFKENQQLKVAELSNMLGVSRTPVRDALLMLENEGFIVTEANSRTYIAPINTDEIKDIYDLVGLLESYAIELGIDNITKDDIKDLRSLNKKFLDATKHGTITDILNADNALHEKIISLGENSKLSDILNSLKDDIVRIEVKYYEEELEDSQSYSLHEKLIDSLEERDLDSAINHVKTNWDETFEDTFKSYKKES